MSVMTKAERLKQARAKKFDTATEAAESMGMKAPTYLAHENGSRDFSGEQAQLYARRLGVSASWLMFGNDKDGVFMPAARDQIDSHAVRTIGRVQFTNKDTLQMLLVAIAGYIGPNLNAEKFAARVIELAGYVSTHDQSPDDIRKLIDFTIQSSKEQSN